MMMVMMMIIDDYDDFLPCTCVPKHPTPRSTFQKHAKATEGIQHHVYLWNAFQSIQQHVLPSKCFQRHPIAHFSFHTHQKACFTFSILAKRQVAPWTIRGHSRAFENTPPTIRGHSRAFEGYTSNRSRAFESIREPPGNDVKYKNRE